MDPLNFSGHIMTTTYYIIVKNGSGSPQEYLLFNEPPVFMPDAGTGLSHIWLRSNAVQSGLGEYVLKITTDNFTMCGELPQPLADGVVTVETNVTAVALATPDGQSGSVPRIAVVEGVPRFVTPFGTQYTRSIWCYIRGWDNNTHSEIP